MNANELRAKHDNLVKIAIASELGQLTDADLKADDSEERILARLVQAAIAGNSAHNASSHELADDEDEDNAGMWLWDFDLDCALASVLWWVIHGGEVVELDEVGIPCVGSAPFAAYAAYKAIKRLKLAAESEIDSLLDGYDKATKTAIEKGLVAGGEA
jgi:hypothetical protein